MADVHDSETRSYNMSQIQAKDTKPELKIRKALHRLGYRYSLHKTNLPGKPDIYLRKYNAVIEINGCFWHGHDCPLFQMPKTNTEFWESKINRNRSNDLNNRKKILEDGIRYGLIWECAIKGKCQVDFDFVIYTTVEWLKGDDLTLEISGDC